APPRWRLAGDGLDAVLQLSAQRGGRVAGFERHVMVARIGEQRFGHLRRYLDAAAAAAVARRVEVEHRVTVLASEDAGAGHILDPGDIHQVAGLPLGRIDHHGDVAAGVAADEARVNRNAGIRRRRWATELRGSRQSQSQGADRGADSQKAWSFTEVTHRLLSP